VIAKCSNPPILYDSSSFSWKQFVRTLKLVKVSPCVVYIAWHDPLFLYPI
jgi:hypothetical protein